MFFCVLRDAFSDESICNHLANVNKIDFDHKILRFHT